MTDLVQFSRALGDATRWRIVRLVMEEALCVCELADILEMPQSSVSSHVQVLRRAGFFESEKCEKWTYFRITPPYRKVLRDLDRFFEGADPTLKRDRARAAKRLSQREQSCCPGPSKLASRNPKRSATR